MKTMQTKPTPTEGPISNKLEAESALRDAACCAAFAAWCETRGVWPRRTHEEVWRTAWNQAKENFRDLLDITAAELVAPNQNYRQGWQDAYAKMKDAVAGGDNRSRLIIQKADDLAECLSSLLFDCVRYRMEPSYMSYVDAENAVAEYRRIIQHNERGLATAPEDSEPS